ncbi:MAG: ATP-binding protein [Candidatus Stygibacter australis]|nr:ATP-binding protein [Candidatus Stygibacter australis]
MFKKRIKKSYISTFSSIFILFAVVIFLSLNSYRYFKTILDNFYLHPFTVTNTGRSLQLKFQYEHYLEREILHENNEAVIEEIVQNILEHKKMYSAYIGTLRSQYLGPVSDIDSLETSYNVWQNYSEKEIYYHTKSLSPLELDEKLSHNLILYEDVNSKIMKIIHSSNNMARMFISKSNSAANKLFLRDLGIFLASLFIIFIIQLIFYKKIYMRLLNMHKVVNKISSGDYEKRCRVDSLDELGELAQNINMMTDQLVGFNHKLEEKVKARTTDLEEEMENLARVKTELEQKDRLAMSIFNSELFGITIWDEAGRLIQVNDVFLSTTGYTQEDIKSEIIDWKTLTPEEYYETELAFHKKLIKEKKALSCEKEVKLKNGNKITVLIAKEVISEEPFRGITFFTDISEQKAVEAELLELRDNLQEKVNERTRELEENMKLMISSRTSLTFLLEDANDSRNEVIKVNKELDSLNKELEAFSYSVSHDLKAPLRAIDGFSSALEEDYYDKLDDEGKEFISLIRNNAQKMGALINDLLEFSRLGRKDINFTEVSMQELVDDVYGDLIVLEKDRKIELKTDNLCTVFADRTMLKQVMINLISNALKFTRFVPETKIEIGCKNEKGSKVLEFYVSDNGVGFDMKYYDKLFGVFQRLHTDDIFEGTGVGLALIKRIISKHKGEVWAEGIPNEGATFRFTLPKQEEKQESISSLQDK